MRAVITGGSSIVSNLGDQAMIFTLIDYLYKKNPDIEITLFDERAFYDRNISTNLRFKVLPDIPMSRKLAYVNHGLSILYRALKKGKRFGRQLEDEIVSEYRNCDLIFQLPGFSISSQMPYERSISRVWDIALARKMGKKIIFLPQSVGPFDFPTMKKAVFIYYLRKYINYPEFVLCREELGRSLLMEYGCKKAELEHDLVMSRPDDIDPGNIYINKTPELPGEFVPDKGKDILVVPNARLLKYRSVQEICSIYETIIKNAMGITGGRACIFAHVTDDDREIANSIYNRFAGEDRVHMMTEGLDCIETEEFFGRFAIGIVARWHSNVHVIRAKLPYIAIGWAEKYKETARLFSNEDMVFDVREPIEEKDITGAIERVYNNRSRIASHIAVVHGKIKDTFCMDRIMKGI